MTTFKQTHLNTALTLQHDDQIFFHLKSDPKFHIFLCSCLFYDSRVSFLIYQRAYKFACSSHLVYHKKWFKG